MMRQSKPSDRQRTKRKLRKVDGRKVLELHRRGLSTAEIAALQQVNPSTIWRFLEREKPEQEALSRFKSGRADELAALGGKAVSVQHMILDSMANRLGEDRMSRTLADATKGSWLVAVNATSGTAFDKERLERGESTSNLSIISRMIDARVQNLYRPRPAAPAESAAPAKAITPSKRVRKTQVPAITETHG